MNRTYRLAVFASGSGTNAEAIFQYFQNHPSIQPVILLSNNPEAPVLARAARFGIPSFTFTRDQFMDGRELLSRLNEKQVTHIVLAGFLWLVPPYLVEKFTGRIINIHPALLPKYGGKGMYGLKVHAAVKNAGEKETGITIHVVNEHYDEGTVLFQTSCAIQPVDSPEDIQAKVQALEYQHFPLVIERWVLEN